VPGQAPLTTWNFINIDGISRQVDYPLLPAYVQQAPDETWTSLPYRSEPDVEITEGPHMGYAIQWFTFAAIIAIGYPVLIRRQTARSLNKEARTHKSTRDAIHDQSIVP
jgi:surfeit locus 1 family protein